MRFLVLSWCSFCGIYTYSTTFPNSYIFEIYILTHLFTAWSCLLRGTQARLSCVRWNFRRIRSVAAHQHMCRAGGTTKPSYAYSSPPNLPIFYFLLPLLLLFEQLCVKYNGTIATRRILLPGEFLPSYPILFHKVFFGISQLY